MHVSERDQIKARSFNWDNALFSEGTYTVVGLLLGRNLNAKLDLNWVACGWFGSATLCGLFP